MVRQIQGLLLVEGVAFLGASLTHFGVLFHGFEHREASIAEAVIATVLATGLVGTILRPGSSRLIGLAAQGFGLAGTLIGVFSMVRGFGPRSTPDLIFHLGMLAVLGFGLIIAYRAAVGTTVE
jgi:hypothetical protein